MPVAQADLEKALHSALNIEHLEVIDTSSGCGQNYAVIIVSKDFEGKLTLARHRLVNELLKDQIAQMHAFSQKTFTPKQWAAEQAKKAATTTEATAPAAVAVTEAAKEKEEQETTQTVLNAA